MILFVFVENKFFFFFFFIMARPIGDVKRTYSPINTLGGSTGVQSDVRLPCLSQFQMIV